MLTPLQIRMARAALRWGVRDLAKKSRVAANTVSRIENGADALAGTLAQIQAALEKAGVVFGPDGSVRLADRRRK